MNGLELDVLTATSRPPVRREADWVSLPTYARLHGVHYHTAVKWLKAGLLRSFRVGRVIRVANETPK